MNSISQFVNSSNLRFQEVVRDIYTSVLFQIAERCPEFVVNEAELEKLGVTGWDSTLNGNVRYYEYYTDLVSYKDMSLAVGRLNMSGIALRFPRINYSTYCLDYGGKQDIKRFNPQFCTLIELRDFERNAFTNAEQPNIDDVSRKWTYVKNTIPLFEFWLDFDGPISENLEDRYKKLQAVKSKADRSLLNSKLSLYKLYLKNRGIPMLAKWNETHHPSR